MSNGSLMTALALKLLVGFAAGILGARTLVVRVRVHGLSMYPTLRNGDALILWRWRARRAAVGDVVAFTTAPSGDGMDLMVKRVVEQPSGTSYDGADWFWFDGDGRVSISSAEMGPVPRRSIRGRRRIPRPTPD